MDVAKRIKELRKSKGISAETLAERLGTNPTTIYRYEKGEIEKMPLSILEPIAEVLGCSPAYLMGWTEDLSPDYIRDMICRSKKEFLAAAAAASSDVHFENNDGVIEEVEGEHYENDQIKKAMELYNKYQAAIPQVQNAVDALLKPAQPDP